MLRWSYQLVLVALQGAFVVQVAPPLARAIQRGTAFGAFPESPLVWVQVAGAVAAIVGTAMALAFPGLVLVRHRQRGHCRFGGLPRWAVALALAGGAAFVLGAALAGLVPLLAPEARSIVTLTARPVANAGLALMAAGVLCAELLRRSVGVPRVVVVPRPSPPHRIEVTHPPELATRVA